MDDHAPTSPNEILPPTEIVVADLVRALDTQAQMALGLSAAAVRAVSYVQAIYGVLIDKGIVSRAELEARIDACVPAVTDLFENEGIFVHHQRDEVDKYDLAAVEAAATVDCEKRFEFCHGACCTLDIILTRQDVDEGVVQWELEDPYIIRQGDDGRCVHQATDLRCTVYEHRPAMCRQYSCENDKRIWDDFENYVPAADLVAHLEERRRGTSHVTLGPPRRRRRIGDPSVPLGRRPAPTQTN